jgi:hypothetical protein
MQYPRIALCPLDGSSAGQPHHRRLATRPGAAGRRRGIRAAVRPRSHTAVGAARPMWRCLRIAAGVSLPLHLLLASGILAFSRPRGHGVPDKVAVVELVMIEQAGAGSPKARLMAQEAPPAAASPLPAEAPTPQLPEVPEAEPLSVASLTEPKSPRATTSAVPPMEATKPQASLTPDFNLDGTDSDSNAIVVGGNVTSTPGTARAASENMVEQNELSSPQLNVTIHYQKRLALAKEAASRLAAVIVARGFRKVSLQSTGHDAKQPYIRYFFREDAPAAAALAKVLDGSAANWQIEDCTSWRHKPKSGTLQVWPIAT